MISVSFSAVLFISELNKIDSMHQDYLLKKNENEMVKQVWLSREISFVEPEAKIFKMIGSVLVSQNLSEAKTNVDNRIEFITKEMYSLLSTRLQKLKEEFIKKAEEKQNKILKMQRDLAAQRQAS
jgi:prefoldin beta subunit